MENKVLQIDSKDNVLIALEDLHQGEQVEYGNHTYELVSEVPAKHKFVTEYLGTGASIVMNGVLVGKAVKPLVRPRKAARRR